ncbi:hypothetical protein V6N13_074871 [Hibiscus sabdariffa]
MAMVSNNHFNWHLFECILAELIFLATVNQTAKIKDVIYKMFEQKNFDRSDSVLVGEVFHLTTREEHSCSCMDFHVFAELYRVTRDYYLLSREHTLKFDYLEELVELEYVKHLSCCYTFRFYNGDGVFTGDCGGDLNHAVTIVDMVGMIKEWSIGSSGIHGERLGVTKGL